MGSRPSPRPKFEIESAFSPEVIARRVNDFLKGTEDIRGIAFPTRIELAISGPDHHFWSPQLVVEMTETETGAHLRARFGPDPYVWALYLLCYVALGLITLLALAFGASQLMLGQSPTALLGLPVLVVLAGLVYGASFVGQGLGSDQMYRLRATLEELTETREDPGREG